MYEKINVVKSFLPPEECYKKYISQIWDSNILTNEGHLLKNLKTKLKKYTSCSNINLVSNGTIALQIALKALDIKDGEIITTPFSYVATLSSILWERCNPVFVDIEADNFCIDTEKIEEKVTPKTKAILATHVFGHACNIEKIDEIAKKYKFKVIYDGAHAFGCKYKGKPLLSYGDISTCSFHSTKIFHTIEGGMCISKSKKIYEDLELIKRFGHNGYDHIRLGINAKMSEMQAAMGLCNLNYINEIIDYNKKISKLYDNLLNINIEKPKRQENLKYNFSYYPILFKDEGTLLKTLNKLNKKNMYPRRYFYPSLNTLPYLEKLQPCPISEDIASRVLCLPLYYGLEEKYVKKIAEVINERI